MSVASLRLVSLAWSASLGIHGLTLAWLTRLAPGPQERKLASSVAFSVVSPERAPAAVPRPQATAYTASAGRVAANAKPPLPPQRTKSRVTPANEAPVDLAGVTLTGGDGAGWSSITGNGLAMDSPIRQQPPSATLTAGTALATAPAATPAHEQPEVVAVKDLATKPAPPALNARLLANYPLLAKRQGLGGSARLLVRIDADGVVRKCSIQSESSAQFGAACRQTLLGSQWTPPRDRQGRRVITQIYYTCDFRVDGP